MDKNIYIFIVWLFLLGCSQQRSSQELQKAVNGIDTLTVVTYEASQHSNKERMTQTVIIGDSIDKVEFSMNKSQRISIRTKQLSNYKYSIKDVYNSEIDTTEILDNFLTITPTDSIFGFKIYRNFDERAAVLSWTDYNKLTDSVETKYMKLKGNQLVSEIKLKVKE